MAKFKFYVATNRVGSKVESVIDIDVDELDEKEKEELIQELFEQWVWDNVSASYEEL